MSIDIENTEGGAIAPLSSLSEVVEATDQLFMSKLKEAISLYTQVNSTTPVVTSDAEEFPF